MKFIKRKTKGIYSSIIILVISTMFIYSCNDSNNDIEKIPKELDLKVERVFPAKANLGDTLSLIGENFKRSIILKIKEKQLEIVFNNDTLIKFKVPYDGFDPLDFIIQIDNGEGVENVEVLSTPFELYKPIIDSIPVNLNYDREVVIYGKHLTNSPLTKYDIVYFNNQNINVKSHSKDSIVFQLPNNIQRFNHNILIKAQLQELELINGVKIPEPSIVGTSKSDIKAGEELMIYLKNFQPNIMRSKSFFIENNKAEILESYKDSILIKMPIGPYESRNLENLKIEVFEKEFSNNLDLKLTSKWYLWDSKSDYELTGGLASVGNLTFWSFYDNNLAHFNVYKNNDKTLNNAIFSYNPENKQWKESIIPIDTKDMSFGNVFYFFPLYDGEYTYLYISRKTNNFYKYNFKTNTLVQLRDFVNDELIQQPTGFVNNGSLYFGLGYKGETSVFQNRTIWKYQEMNNSWEKITEIPLVNDSDLRNGVSVFKYNGKFYIGNGNEHTTNFWEYTPDNQWVRKEDIPYSSQYAINVQVNERGFYYNKYLRSFFEYDIIKDEWIERNDLSVEEYNLRHEYMFIHNNYVYFVGEKNKHLILRTELSNF